MEGKRCFKKKTNDVLERAKGGQERAKGGLEKTKGL